MPHPPFSARLGRLLPALAPLYEAMTQSEWARRQGDPAICDFMVGNPHEMPLPGLVEALQRWAVPESEDWFAYKTNEAVPRATIAASLRQRHGLPFEAEDIFLTLGAFGALAVALDTILDPGDQVIFITPPWFFYEALILARDGHPVRVPCGPATHDLDVDAIAAAITPRTRAVIVNSPNNPTGRIYPAATLARLAQALSEASARNDRRIWLLSDESYCRIVYDGRACPTPTAYYPSAFLIYTYGKTLLAPGQRLGYLALPPTLEPEVRALLHPALLVAQLTLGHVIPNALMQHALADLEALSIDVGRLQARRDRMVAALASQGYELRSPEGTFYLLVRSPLPDDRAFCDRLARSDIFVLPGALFEMPGYFRISLTASDEMVERSLPGFAAAIAEARAGATPGPPPQG